jgi:hypothetical protein
MIMGVPEVGGGMTNPKTPAPPTWPPAWSSSGPPACLGTHLAHSFNSSANRQAQQ